MGVIAANEYRCAHCGEVYEKGWSDEDAMAECQSIFGVVDPSALAVICDDCFNLMRAKRKQ